MFSRFTRKTIKLPPIKGATAAAASISSIQLPQVSAATVTLPQLQLVQPVTPCNSPNISPRLSVTPDTDPITPSTTCATPVTKKSRIIISENSVEVVDNVFINPSKEEDENFVLCVKTLEPTEIVYINDVMSSIFTKTMLPYKHRHDLYWMSEDFLLQYLDYSLVITYDNYESIIPLYDIFTIFPINAENMVLHRALEKAVSELNFICYQRESAKRVVLTMVCNIIYSHCGIRVKIIKYIGGS